MAAIGNANVGIISGGMNLLGILNSTEKFVYSGTDVLASVSGTALGLSSTQLAAIGSSSIGIFAGGNINTGSANPMVTNQTNKYTYATDAVSPGTSLGIARSLMAGTGNGVVGILTGGWGDSSTNISQHSVDYTDKYNFETDVVVPGCALGIPLYGLAAASNAAVGLFAGGVINNETSYVVRKYYYCLDVIIPGSNLQLARWGLAGVSNSNPNSCI
jgi:hypothetical protein